MSSERAFHGTPLPTQKRSRRVRLAASLLSRAARLGLLPPSEARSAAGVASFL